MWNTRFSKYFSSWKSYSLIVFECLGDWYLWVCIFGEDPNKNPYLMNLNVVSSVGPGPRYKLFVSIPLAAILTSDCLFLGSYFQAVQKCVCSPADPPLLKVLAVQHRLCVRKRTIIHSGTLGTPPRQHAKLTTAICQKLMDCCSSTVTANFTDNNYY